MQELSLARTVLGNKFTAANKGEQQSLPKQLPIYRRIFKHPYLMHYHRLFLLACIVNAYIFFSQEVSIQSQATGLAFLKDLSVLTLTNLSLAILIRQQLVINLLFWLATRAPKSWPLKIRATLGKVYHFGGIHSGCAIAGTFWFVFYFVQKHQIAQQFELDAYHAIAIIDASILVALIAMIAFSAPQFRAKYHNQFEIIHRLCGWVLLLLFWLQNITLSYAINSELLTLGDILLSPTSILLLLVTLSVLLPWLRLKKVRVDFSRPSPHVTLANFDYGVTPFAGSSTAISRRPLLEWHSFANVPSPNKSGYRLTISRAGDWTGKLIDDLPSHVWTKGIPTAGVGNIDQLFNKVIWVATGSGIGPCLPHLLLNQTESLLLWVTKNPRKTYGDELVDEILKVQPNAIIWDTDEKGKPDMLQLAYQIYQSFPAEAVICISNKKLTWEIVYGFESRGTPAFGAIWDS